MKRTLLILVFVVTGCGGSALQYHAQAADALRLVNDRGVELVETECEERATAAASDRSVDTDTAEANAQAVLSTCQRIQSAQHVFAEAHTSWVYALVLAVAEETFDEMDVLELAVRAVQLYVEVVALAADFDLALPEPPPRALGLLGGDS